MENDKDGDRKQLKTMAMEERMFYLAAVLLLIDRGVFEANDYE